MITNGLCKKSFSFYVAFPHLIVGMFFWDYGNSFLLEARRAGADVSKKGAGKNSIEFRYPSYVQDIMG